MIALWMAYTMTVAAVMAVAAGLLERATVGTLRQRRWIWLAALVVSTVLPVWSAVATRSTPTHLSAGGATTMAPAPSPASIAAEFGQRLAELASRADAAKLARYDSRLAIAWLAAALLGLGAFGVANWTLAARRRAWRATRVDGEDVLLSFTVGPAVIGAIRPRIVVPEWSLTLPPEQRALMLEHERQHIRSRDPLLLHIAALLTLAMPWNVVAWWITRRLRIAVELDCDARVLASGRDVRAYGALLLDVCARRMRGPILAPALFDRTSSLTRRILAMHPARVRHARVRVALGAAAALVAVAVACEMPSPEMLAPDGKDVATARVYGGARRSADLQTEELRALIAQRFPEVARGEGGPRILYVVRSAEATILLSESQAADELLRSRGGGLERRGGSHATSSSPSAVQATAGEGEVRVAATWKAALLPGVAALRPDDIEAIDVSKHAAGSLAPERVSVILIALKPGINIPTSR